MSDSEDDYAYYGILVEQPDEGNTTARKAPRLEDQVATDKQGKRRFHGAFTGGFSAGHFNTVGSVEGFTPSTFTSSRAERNKAATQTVEMFMDDEDRSAHGIAAERLQATADFTSSSDGVEARKRKRLMPSSGPIPGTPVLLDIVADTSDSVGVRLLKSLGWREGQGVGPRLSHREKTERRKMMKQRKESANSITQPDSGDEGELPSQYSSTTFAPDDTSGELACVLRYKCDIFGLGYKPLSRDNILGTRQDWLQPRALAITEKKKTLMIKGQAFGVGAFEEEDEDIYVEDDMSHYDFTLGGAGRSKSSDKNSKEVPLQKPNNMSELCDVLEGFVLSSARHVFRPNHSLPTLPPGYVPRHVTVRKRFSSLAFEQRGLGRHDLTHTDRHRIREGTDRHKVEVRTGVKGVKPPPAPPSSRPSSPTATSTPAEALAVKVYVEELLGDDEGPRTQYRPFASDADKQRRYELYVRMKEKGYKDRFSEVQPSSLTEWEKSREQGEFERAARLYKPLTSAMATRFVTSSVEDGTPLLKDGLNMNIRSIHSSIKSESSVFSETSSTVLDSSAATSTSTSVSSDPRVNAASAGMFGKQTQLVQDWHPERLLCKRFNVPPPYPDSKRVGVVTDSNARSEKTNIFNFLSSTPTLRDTKMRPSERASGGGRGEFSDGGDKRQADSGGVERHAGGLDDALQEKDTPDKYGLKVSVDGPPTMDLFKAIFDASSSDSSDADSSAEEDLPEKDKNSPNDEEKKRRRRTRFEPLDDTEESRLINANTRKSCEKDDIDRNEETGAGDKSLQSGLCHGNHDAPKHVFMSRKKTTLYDGLIETACVSKTKTGDVKVTFLKGVKEKESIGKKSQAAKLLSKSNLSFYVESDESEEEMRPSIVRGQPNKKSVFKLANAKRERPSNKLTHSALSHEKDENTFNDKQLNSVNCESALSTKELPITGSKSELQRPLKLSHSIATGIFANIDFAELNRYRAVMNDEKGEGKAADTTDKMMCISSADLHAKNKSLPAESNGGGGVSAARMATSVSSARQDSSDDDESSASSVASNEAYGAALPPNFVNQMQVIRQSKKESKVSSSGPDVSECVTVWSERTFQSKERSDKKKDKKKKKERHRNKSHKKEKKKKRSR